MPSFPDRFAATIQTQGNTARALERTMSAGECRKRTNTVWAKQRFLMQPFQTFPDGASRTNDFLAENFLHSLSVIRYILHDGASIKRLFLCDSQDEREQKLSTLRNRHFFLTFAVITAGRGGVTAYSAAWKGTPLPPEEIESGRVHPPRSGPNSCIFPDFQAAPAAEDLPGGR